MTQQLLLEHPLVASLTDDERDRVLHLFEVVDVPSGGLLLVAGAPAFGLYLLLDGTVLVSPHVAGTVHEGAVLGPGSWVGELSLLDGRPATADVRALGDLTVARVGPEHWDELLAVDAVVLQLDALARRRRATNRAFALPPIHAGVVDGDQLHLRPLWPKDWRQMATARHRLSERSLRLRFFTVPPMTERTFRRLTSTDHDDQFAWGLFLRGDLVGIGRHALQAEERRVAEVAVTVADDLQGRGLGAVLVTAIAAAAAAHGAEELSALARSENEGVQRLLTGFGAVWTHRGDEGTASARWPVDVAMARARDTELRDRAGALAAEVLAEVSAD